jgi:hypothetical protein
MNSYWAWQEKSHNFETAKAGDTSIHVSPIVKVRLGFTNLPVSSDALQGHIVTGFTIDYSEGVLKYETSIECEQSYLAMTVASYVTM